MRSCEDNRKPGMCQRGCTKRRERWTGQGKEGEIHLAVAEIFFFSLNLRLGFVFSSLFSSVLVLPPKYPVVIPLQSFLMMSIYNRVVFCGWLMYRWHNPPQI